MQYIDQQHWAYFFYPSSAFGLSNWTVANLFAIHATYTLRVVHYRIHHLTHFSSWQGTGDLFEEHFHLGPGFRANLYEMSVQFLC